MSSKIAFSRPMGAQGQAIWSVAGDGRDRVQLTRPPKDARDNEPKWSPDRKRIAFTREIVVGEDFRDDFIYREHLTVMNADGSALRKLAVHGHDPAWSPDGTRIAFVKNYAEDEEIWTIKPGGSGARRLGPGGYPAWSPDGRLIAFERWTGARTETFVMSASGSAKRKLLPTARYENSSPAWSPNGRQIALVGSPIGVVDMSLYVVNPSGKDLRKLAGRVSSKDTNLPAWSGDGLKLLIEREQSSDFDSAFVVSVGGGRLRRLATHTDYPDWSPDGRSIVYVRSSETSPNLRVMSAAGGTSRRIARGVAWDVDW